MDKKALMDVINSYCSADMDYADKLAAGIVGFVAAWMDQHDVRHQTVENVISRWREEMGDATAAQAAGGRGSAEDTADPAAEHR